MELEHPRDDDKRACMRCLWWRPTNSVVGYCKRMPPARQEGGSEGFWPMTGRGDWCGEFREGDPA